MFAKIYLSFLFASFFSCFNENVKNRCGEALLIKMGGISKKKIHCAGCASVFGSELLQRLFGKEQCCKYGSAIGLGRTILNSILSMIQKRCEL
jgi:hypothetical protein